MSDFSLYFGLGKDHILDYANGYDHILFVIALCALYINRDCPYHGVYHRAFDHTRAFYFADGER